MDIGDFDKWPDERHPRRKGQLQSVRTMDDSCSVDTFQFLRGRHEEMSMGLVGLLPHNLGNFLRRTEFTPSLENEPELARVERGVTYLALDLEEGKVVLHELDRER
jgi:hypothetical protein